VSVVLDAGALIAIDRGNRSVMALLRVAQRNNVPVCTSGGVVAQTWRQGARQVILAKTLQGITVAAIDGPTAKRIGELLSVSNSADIVDAHVALLAADGDRIVTSDPQDIAHLTAARNVHPVIVPA
jgi:hypothetical protein